MRPRRPHNSLGVRLLCALSLLFVAFSHRPVDVGHALQGVDPAYHSLAYMLPDGTIPIICVTDPSDPGKGQHPLRHIFGASCDACRISSAIICPAPLAVSDAFLQIETAFNFIPAAPILYRVAYPPAAPPQAPPLA